MAAKEVKFGAEARTKMLEGVDILANEESNSSFNVFISTVLLSKLSIKECFKASILSCNSLLFSSSFYG